MYLVRVSTCSPAHKGTLPSINCVSDLQFSVPCAQCPVRKGYSSISASTEQNQQSGGSAAKIIPARHTPLEQRESSELLEGRGCHSGRGPGLQSKAQV